MKKWILPILCAIFVLASTVPCLASESYNFNGTNLPMFEMNYGGKNYEYAYITNGSNEGSSDDMFFLYLTNYPLYTTDGYSLFSSTNGGCVSFHLNNGTWEYVAAYSYAQNTRVGNYSGFKGMVWSTFDIPIKESADQPSTGIFFRGDLNFLQAPLEEVIAEELTMKTVPKIIQAISTLALCGVGSMALLVGLPLLSKALKKFLPN